VARTGNSGAVAASEVRVCPHWTITSASPSAWPGRGSAITRALAVLSDRSRVGRPGASRSPKWKKPSSAVTGTAAPARETVRLTIPPHSTASKLSRSSSTLPLRSDAASSGRRIAGRA
jgi:hypothetical protein